MRNLVTGFFAVVIGLFAVSFATIMALFLGLAAMIAKPFIKRKLAAEGMQFEENNFTEGFAGQDETMNSVFRQQRQTTANVIDGEYEDVTSRKF
ncbi:hypothetical protein [Photobacterium toruni]|uniref:Uncharacterized protein n=1 Tax=Photobacterium toruni TaxID=1935446 RepID=A0A1T4TW64_9GAMM|nr:hypothetical protein [Photobacterium toruni]MEC6815123.1 hypothetical protein [Photobacterium toruni]MEC6831120.1 hypothetical protein [Photobacterium toruni]SKA44469.1 hypothetical protein CZ814_02514 [Photobacterium toruni]